MPITVTITVLYYYVHDMITASLVIINNFSLWNVHKTADLYL